MKNVFKGVLFLLVLVLSAALIYAAANAPAFSPAIGAKSVNEGQPLNFIVTSSAADVGAINFSVCTDAPCVGTKVNAINKDQQITIGSTKVNYSYLSVTQMGFNWTPDFTQSGAYKFRFNITDDDTDNSFEDVTVTVVDIPPKLTATATLKLGGDTQERSDPNHDTDDRREVNVTGTITLTNDGPEALNSLKGTVTVASGFTEKDLTVNFTLPKTSLAVGESISVPVSVRVPQKLDAINKAFQRIDVNVASLTFSATPAVSGGTVSGVTQLSLRAENNLRIKNVKVKYGTKSETVDDGDTVKDLKAGQTIDFEIELENRFKNKQDVKIEDITLKVESDSQIDIDEDEDVGDLSPEDKDTIKFSSVIDEDADDGTYNVEISVDGTDEFGARHGEKLTARFEIKRKSHEIEVKSLTLNPPTVSCEKETRLSANIRNSGRRDEDEVFVAVESPELKFGARSDKLSLDEDDEDTVSFTVPVPESTPRPANYRITVDTYYNSDTKSNSEVVLLNVAKCGAEEEKKAEVAPPAEEKKKEEVTVVTVPPPQPQANITAPQAPAKKSFLETPQYVALLVLGYVVVLGGGAALLIKLMKPQ